MENELYGPSNFITLTLVYINLYHRSLTHFILAPDVPIIGGMMATKK
jgi:hypothetical protein